MFLGESCRTKQTENVFLYESSLNAMTIDKFPYLVDAYRNTIFEWAVGFRYGSFTLELARDN